VVNEKSNIMHVDFYRKVDSLLKFCLKNLYEETTVVNTSKVKKVIRHYRELQGRYSVLHPTGLIFCTTAGFK
jgi:hypothetical protein